MATTSLNEEEVFDGYDITELRALKRQAELGYSSMELFEPPAGAKWGMYNDRKVEDKAVKKLVEAYKGLVDNCTEGTAIDVAVRRGWLEEAASFHSTVEGMRIGEVNELKFSAAGEAVMKQEHLVMLGGNHRREAVMVYVGEKKKKREEIAKKLEVGGGKGKKSGRGGAKEGGRTQEDVDEEMKRMVRKLDADIAKASRWVVRVYDRGKWHIRGTSRADNT